MKDKILDEYYKIYQKQAIDIINEINSFKDPFSTHTFLSSFSFNIEEKIHKDYMNWLTNFREWLNSNEIHFNFVNEVETFPLSKYSEYLEIQGPLDRSLLDDIKNGISKILEDFKLFYNNFEPNKNKFKQNKIEEKIIIYIVKRSDKEVGIYVGRDLENSFPAKIIKNKLNKKTQCLVDVAENGSVSYEDERVIPNIIKYFNSEQGSPIYKKIKRKILIKIGNEIRAADNIVIRSITEEERKRILGQLRVKKVNM